ncbi:hypothetical protein AYI68_g5042 [Smittium mucronatum]|uniref:Uncharacterized protein n=1 Tax=Smittium mucronatum TaxID=133383 RepID=A0A1R0GVD3_9FUNG|nr:hypothetical protein AYI68_g5042 [Smittium mucronatum]
MDTIGTVICSYYENLQVTRRGSVCFKGEQEIEILLQFFIRKVVHRPELPLIQLRGLVQPLLLPPPLESYHSSDSEGEIGATENRIDYAAMKYFIMVPGPSAIIDKPATAFTSKKSGLRSKKLKISAIQQQEMVLDEIEDQRSIIKVQDFKKKQLFLFFQTSDQRNVDSDTILISNSIYTNTLAEIVVHRYKQNKKSTTPFLRQIRKK